MSQNQTMPKSDLKSANECTPYIMYEIEVKGKSLDTAYSSWKTSQPGPFNPRLFNPMVQKFMVEKSGVEKFTVEKSRVEKFTVEKSGVERSGVGD